MGGGGRLTMLLDFRPLFEGVEGGIPLWATDADIRPRHVVDGERVGLTFTYTHAGRVTYRQGGRLSVRVRQRPVVVSAEAVDVTFAATSRSVPPGPIEDLHDLHELGVFDFDDVIVLLDDEG